MTAQEIAQAAHAYQFRRDGRTPYIVHPMKVASFFQPYTYRWEAAWLHDVIEDSDWTAEMLLSEGIDNEVVEAVEILTRHKEESYDQFIERISMSVSQIAIDVKIADLLANLSDAPRKNQLIRYGEALNKLAFHTTHWK